MTASSRRTRLDPLPLREYTPTQTLFLPPASGSMTEPTRHAPSSHGQPFARPVLYRVIVTVLMACVIGAGASVSATALAQPTIGIYRDAAGTGCSLSDTQPGFFNAYVVATPDFAGVIGVQFSAPRPPCFTGVYIGDQQAPATLVIGNSQTGASVALMNCYGTPTHVLTIRYYAYGTTPACCGYPVLPDTSLNEIILVDCTFAEKTAASADNVINQDETCLCQGNHPPLPPFGPLPADGASDQSTYSSLSWQATDSDNNIAEYDVYFGTVPSPPLVATVTTPGYTPSPLPLDPLAQFYWRVVVRDSVGEEASGPEWSFTTQVRPSNYPPNPPLSPVPAHGSQHQPVTLTLAWTANDPDGDDLVFDVYLGPTQSPPLVAADVPDPSFAPASLEYSTTYWWRIVARDPVGAEASGVTWSFTTRPANYPPNAPSSPSPSNNSTGRPLATTLAWQCTDPDGQALTYDVYFGTTLPPPLVASNVAQASFPPGTLTFLTQYRWRVVARDPAGAETSGATWTFTTVANSPPNLPSNPVPASGALNRPVNSTLAWQCTDPEGHAIVYDVYFGTASTPPLVASNIVAKSFNPGPLTISTTYRWRIVARDELGAQRVGSPWSFQTVGNTAPVPPSEPSPADGRASTLSPVLTWTSFDPDVQQLTYTVRFGTTSSPPPVVTGLTTRSFAPGTLQVGVRYFWKVSVSDGIAAASGPLWSFTAVEPGDVDLDGQVTVADAGCALDAFLRGGALAPGCGGSVGVFAADAGCNDVVTPHDARCIHKHVVDGSCMFCTEGIAAGTGAVISANSAWIVGDTLRVTLKAADAALRAFGFSVHSPSKLKLVGVTELAVRFDALGASIIRHGLARVGGYALGATSTTAPTAFVELHFAPAGSASGWLHINDFVDDLDGAAPVQISLDALLTAVPPVDEVVLQQNHPNPFNPQTSIRYDLPAWPEPRRVQLRILDVTGGVVRTLVDGQQKGGSYEALWNGTDDGGNGVSSGIYFSVLDAGGERRTRKLVLLK